MALSPARRIQKIQKNPNTRHHPVWDYYEWIMHKSRYMKQCTKAGIPMIDTIHVENGFKAREVLKKIVAKGWDKFFVKPAYMSFFGAGVINGSLVATYIDDTSVIILLLYCVLWCIMYTICTCHTYISYII